MTQVLPVEEKQPWYAAPYWLPGGDVQTIWSALLSKRSGMARTEFTRRRYTTPDKDFIDIDWCTGASDKGLLVIFHGLEGSSRSHYVEAYAAAARKLGWGVAVPHFRGCSGEMNLAPRAYHSGDIQEIDWILRLVVEVVAVPAYCIGVSLGGNALAHWAATLGANSDTKMKAIATVSAPLDLMASGKAIGSGMNRYTYNQMFLWTMKRKAEVKWKQYPGLFDLNATRNAKTIFDFDNAFTAPVHGYKNAEDYWQKASAKPQLSHINIPTLLINAKNDPFVPKDSLPTKQNTGDSVTLWQPQTGGHVGFTSGPMPGSLTEFSDKVVKWLAHDGRFQNG